MSRKFLNVAIIVTEYSKVEMAEKVENKVLRGNFLPNETSLYEENTSNTAHIVWEDK